MGLDWIELVRDEEDNTKFHSCRSFRGKGVSHDPNIEDEIDTNDCYGTEGSLEYFPGHVMTSDQRARVISAIKAVLSDPDSEYDDIDEWAEFMEDALEFLESSELIYCWF
jgi:hypothetical protein